MSTEKLLHFCKIDDIDKVKNCDYYGVDLVIDKDQNTLLHICAKYNSVRYLTFLIKQGADIHKKNNENDTPLHVAIRKDSAECLRVLIENGANINEPSSWGWTPIFEACVIDSVDCLKILIEKGADIYAISDENGEYPFHRCIQYGSYQCFRYILDSTSMHANIKDGKGNTPLHYAILEGGSMMTILLQKGANEFEKNNEGESIGFAAARYGTVYALDELITTRGHDINQRNNKGQTLLHACAMNVDFPNEGMEFLFECGIDHKIMDVYGRTALHYAAEYTMKHQHNECVKFLIKKGSNFSIRDNDGKIFLDYIEDDYLKKDIQEFINERNK